MTTVEQMRIALGALEEYYFDDTGLPPETPVVVALDGGHLYGVSYIHPTGTQCRVVCLAGAPKCRVVQLQQILSLAPHAQRMLIETPAGDFEINLLGIGAGQLWITGRPF